MKLFIEEPLYLKISDNTKEIFSRFSIIYKEENNYIKVLRQNVSLDELNMNILFEEFCLNSNFSIEYSYSGGKGCEFSLDLKGLL